MADVETREISTEATAEAKVRDDGLWLGDAIDFFLSAKRAGGRSEKTVDDYRKKLELFQRWLAARLGGEDEVDAPYIKYHQSNFEFAQFLEGLKTPGMACLRSVEES